MRLTDEVRSGAQIVALKGRLDSRSAEACAASLLSRIADGRQTLALDMRGVDYLGSAGLRMLLLLHLRAHQRGVLFELHLLPPAIAETLAVSGVCNGFLARPDSAN